MAGRDHDHSEMLFGLAGHMVVVVVSVFNDKDVVSDCDGDTVVVGAGISDVAS